MPIGNPTDSQEGVNSNKRSRPDSEAGSLQAKKIKIEEEVDEDEKDDSGYLTNFDASSLNLGEASFNNMIKFFTRLIINLILMWMYMLKILQEGAAQ